LESVVVIERMERRKTPRTFKDAPAWTTERRERAIFLTFLEAREARRKGDAAEFERLMDLAANAQRELDGVYA
jgi:hypothetical protein